MSTLPFKILFLCTGNSARSILAEYIIRRLDPKRFESFSAGAKPTGKVNPLALRLLKENFRVDASDARSKSWEEFRNVSFDFVITLCDQARETCPVWPGQPIIAHWGFEDPATFTGTEEERMRATSFVALQIRRRLDLFCSLPLEKMERIRLEHAIKDIGRKETLTKENDHEHH